MESYLSDRKLYDTWDGLHRREVTSCATQDNLGSGSVQYILLWNPSYEDTGQHFSVGTQTILPPWLLPKYSRSWEEAGPSYAMGQLLAMTRGLNLAAENWDRPFHQETHLHKRRCAHRGWKNWQEKSSQLLSWSFRPKIIVLDTETKKAAKTTTAPSRFKAIVDGPLSRRKEAVNDIYACHTCIWLWGAGWCTEEREVQKAYGFSALVVAGFYRTFVKSRSSCSIRD